MSRILSSLTILVALVCSVFAQTSSDSLGPPQSCVAAQSIPNINLTALSGTWFEVARQPSNNWNCIQVDIANRTVDSNNILYINVTVAAKTNMLNMNTTMTANVTVNNVGTSGLNVSFVDGSTTRPNVTFKFLDTNYTNYTYVCGYTNASDPSTSFGVILTRERVPPTASLTQYQTSAAAQYSDFSKNMTLITQSSKCYTNSASSSVPAFATVFTILFAILKYFN